MNKYLYLTLTVFMLTVQKAFCLTEAVSPELEQSLKVHTNEPSAFHIIFALVFVVFLIYITGIIYSKLNLVGAKTLKEQFKNADIDRAIVISTTQLGQNKNLHVIEINNKRYLIGATQNSINLVKDLGQVADKEEPIEKVETIETEADIPAQPQSSEEDIDKAIKFLYGKSHESLINQPSPSEEEFNIHKKYLQ